MTIMEWSWNWLYISELQYSYLCSKVHLDLSVKSDCFSRTSFIDYCNKNVFHKRKSSLIFLM